MLTYLTSVDYMPRWNISNLGLEDIFYDSSLFTGNIRERKSFALYRDESQEIRHNIYHPIDYVSHDVRIVIGEFDSKSHINKCKIDNKRVSREIEVIGNISKMEVKFPLIQEKKFKEDLYTKHLFSKLSEDERILFCYVTTSGEGLRFGFKVDDRINNDLEYLANYYYYGKKFLKHDIEEKFGLEYTCSKTGSLYELTNMCSVYWLLPVTSSYSCKDSKELKKI